jgi:hypothetical protein
MPTVEDLGRKAKRKDPHRYGHLSDAEAGRQAKRDYPGYYTQYEDISDSIIKAHQNPLNQNQSVNEINSFGDMINDLMQAMQIPGNDRLEAYNTALDRHLNPNRGWFTAKWQNSKAAARLELAQTIGQERYEVLEQMMRYAERVRQGKMDEIAFKQFIADAAIRLMETQSRANRVIEADSGNPRI